MSGRETPNRYIGSCDGGLELRNVQSTYRWELNLRGLGRHSLLPMAIVADLIPGHRNSQPHPTSVECEFQSVDAGDGKRFFQLASFGSPERQSERKVSQTLQFSEAMARSLVIAIRETFPEA